MPTFRDNERIRAVITRSTKPRRIDYPGHPDLTIGVRGLDDPELDACRIEAQKKIHDLAKKRAWDPVQVVEIDPELLQRYVEREIILKAFCDPDTVDDDKPTPFFANEHELGRVGSTGITDLMNAYIEHQEWSNPNVTLTQELEDELVEALGKEQSAGVYLMGFEQHVLRRLLISTVKRLHDYRTGKSSTSSK